MQTIREIKENGDGTHTAIIDYCTNAVLAQLLNPDVPYVWSVNCFLEDSYNWVMREINLSKDGPLHRVDVRNLSFDLFMATGDYLAILEEFSRQGNILLQCHRRIPPGLDYWKLPEQQRMKILLQNGVYSEFCLPHDHETASFTCIDRFHMERAIRKLNGEGG